MNKGYVCLWIHHIAILSKKIESIVIISCETNKYQFFLSNPSIISFAIIIFASCWLLFFIVVTIFVAFPFQLSEIISNGTLSLLLTVRYTDITKYIEK
jgi:hypothetical protein